MHTPKNMLQLFARGDVLYGYCNGFFGRDSYTQKTCVLVRPTYAVFEYLPLNSETIAATTLNFGEGCTDLTFERVTAWKTPPDTD